MKKILLILSLFAFNIVVLLSDSDYFIGAYDPQHWAGITFSSKDKQGFGIFLEIEKNNETASGHDIYYLIKNVGPNSGDGKYSKIVVDTSLPFKKGNDTPILDKSKSSDTVVFEWSRIGGNKVVGIIKVESNVTIYINFYEPWDYKNIFDYEKNYIFGRSDNYNFYFISKPDGEKDDSKTNFRLKYRVKKGDSIFFSIELTKKMKEKVELVSNIKKILKNNREYYNQHRVRISGENESLVESIVNNINWIVSIQPEVPAIYTPAGRHLILPSPDNKSKQWTIFQWDSFFNAFELSLESYKLAKSTLKAVLKTQYENGNIPNWRSRWAGTLDRSQPPIGSFIILRLYRRFKDRSLLEFAYPYLKNYNFFWTDKVSTGNSRRDGNDNGLLEWGSDQDLLQHWVPEWELNADGRKRAAWESGQNDLPNFDNIKYNENTWTLELDCVDLNSLFALDNECLAIIAEILGNHNDEEVFTKRYLRTKLLMNDKMWDEKQGIYRDLEWKGKLSSKIAASNFYPLIAGIPDKKKAKRMLKNLMDTELFWGDYVIPTINKKDPAYKDQQYWRGTIHPPINYLIYQGLLRYDFFKEAAELSKKSVKLFLNIWKKYKLCRGSYNSKTGEAGGNRYQSWGPILALIGVEEFINWDIYGNVKIGSFYKGKTSVLKNIKDYSNSYTITLSEEALKVVLSKGISITSSSPIIIKDLKIRKRSCEMIILTDRKTRVTINGLQGNKFNVYIDSNSYSTKRSEITLNLIKGEFKTTIRRINIEGK